MPSSGDVEAARSVLNSLTERHKETDVAQELKSSTSASWIHRGDAGGPIRPNRQRDILTRRTARLVLAAGSRSSSSTWTNTLKTPDDVRTHLGSPTAGRGAGDGPGAGRPAIRKGGSTQSTFAEAYRVIRTSLNYSWPNAGPASSS